MSSVDFVAVPASSPYVPFDDLHLGRSNQEVVCRLLRFWDARNIRKDNEFMGIVVLLLDEKNSTIHAFIPATRAAHYRRFLVEGSIIKLSAFEVSRCTKLYKITDHPFVIRFLYHTKVDQISDNVPMIGVEKFMMRKMDHLQALANTNLELPDVVGQIRFVQGSNLDDATSIQRVVIRLLIEPSVTVSLTLWDDAAATFRAHLGSDTGVHSTMIATTVNPKIFGGGLFLNSTPATRFYFDTSIKAIEEFNARMGIEEQHTFSRVDTTLTVAKMETLSIRELYAYISQSPEQVQEAEFLCKATIVDVLRRNGWSYVSCGSCSRKLERIGTTLRCKQCVYPIVTGVPRYRVELAVTDGKTDSTFVVFDTEMTKLTCKTASTLIAEAGENGEDSLPLCLADLTGKHYCFQIKVTPFNFTPNHRSFTVARMTETEAPPIEEVTAVDERQDGEEASNSGGGATATRKRRREE